MKIKNLELIIRTLKAFEENVIAKECMCEIIEKIYVYWYLPPFPGAELQKPL